MSFSKVLFVGLGGAGQRHLRILRQLLPAETVFLAYRRTGRTPLLRPNFSVDDSRTVESAYGIRMIDSLDAAFAERPDLTVVSTPTSFHRQPMMMAAEAGTGILVEKPWAEGLEGFGDFSAQVRARELPFLISFQRRFHPLIRQARQAIATGAIGRPMAAEFTVYSNVPSWHPYEDWRKLYAVRPELGGGVLLTEIHEIDLAHWFFGMPTSVFCAGGNRSAHALDVEDTVHLTLVYPQMCVQITLCFMHDRPSRRFHVAGTDGDITWDGDDNTLTMTSRSRSRDVQTAPEFPNDAMFVAQAEQFVSKWAAVDSQGALDAAGGSLAIVDAARRSMSSTGAELVSTTWQTPVGREKIGGTR